MKNGYTTGACAAAGVKAALLFEAGRPWQTVHLTALDGTELRIPVKAVTQTGGGICAEVVKFSGDDPDITHGMLVYAAVCNIPHGIDIDGGKGVGRVTRPGLAQPVGTAAINPGPREQITRAVQDVAHKYGYTGGFSVVISIPEGKELGARTFNPKLGIVGGLSVLGTSGIVEPMSEQALIDTIHIDMDSRYADGQRELLLCPGNYGEDFARDTLGLDIARGVKCSNFIGEALDYAVYRGFSNILLVGHAGKLIKLAAGVFQTHSAYADARQEIFAAHAALCGASAETVRTLMEAVTVDACLDSLRQAGLDKPVLQSISQKVQSHLVHRVCGKTGRQIGIEYVIFTNPYGILMQSDGAQACIAARREKERQI